MKRKEEGGRGYRGECDVRREEMRIERREMRRGAEEEV